jgi:AraC-like DNA-binding protein
MDYSKIINQLQKVPPPQQPWLGSSALNYEQRLVEWNPVCTKNSALYYQFTTGDRNDCFVGIMPDACINIIFKCSESDPVALVSGVYEDFSKIMLEPNTTYFGFKPYSVAGVKTPEAEFKELKNQTVKLDSIYKTQSIMDNIAAKGNLHDRIKSFQNYAMSHLIDEKYTPNLVECCAILVCLSGGRIGLEEIESETGYSERHCREKFKETYGISIKHYSRIVRFQNALRMIATEKMIDISDVVYEAGYFDQSHFIKEFKHFADTSPVKFRNTYIDILNRNNKKDNEGDGISTGVRKHERLILPSQDIKRKISLYAE